MPKTLFDVSYDIVTPESAEHGDVDERGFISQGETLREAIKLVHRTRTNKVDGCNVEADTTRGNRYRWVTVSNGAEFETGAHETRYLHIPLHVTHASARRIARLAGVRK
jgi:hypothetical protein